MNLYGEMVGVGVRLNKLISSAILDLQSLLFSSRPLTYQNTSNYINDDKIHMILDDQVIDCTSARHIEQHQGRSIIGGATDSKKLNISVLTARTKSQTTTEDTHSPPSHSRLQIVCSRTTTFFLPEKTPRFWRAITPIHEFS